MSVLASSTTHSVHSSEHNKSEVIRRLPTNFHPSIWGNHFITNASNKVFDVCDKQIETLKKEVRTMLMVTPYSSSQKMNLIDALQRLGVAYHFEREIEDALVQIYDTFGDYDDDYDLHNVSLRFRLLRQQGYNVPCDVFNKFKDDKGNFKGSLIDDVRGLLCMYEATHLRLNGENILDEALAFSTTHLKSMVTHLNTPLSTQVMHALEQPLHKGIPRLEARHYISVYQEDESWNELLLKLAKLDFNLLQSLHKEELSDISKWWRDLDVPSKLPFAKDRLVECYFWILGVYFEPHYSLSRKMLTKVIALTSIIDDIYDEYGTLEELRLFTNAIERWEISLVDQLPDPMKMIFHALLDVYNEMEEEMTKEGKSYSICYAKEAMEKLVKAYFVEAKWSFEGYTPTLEEYMHIALKTCCYHMISVTSFVGMGEIVTKEAFDWVINEPMLVKASTIICRLMDDMVDYETDQERENAVSTVGCYMKQHGVSVQEALNEFRKRVENAWKDINQGCLKPNAVPMPLLMRVVNLARVMDVLYKHGDGYTNAGTSVKDYITSLLINPIPI